MYALLQHRRHTALLLPLFVSLQLGCGDPATDSDTATSNITTSSQTGTGTGESTAGSGGTDGGTGSTGESTGGEDGEELCQRYIECVAVTSPSELPQVQEGFGAGSLCWTQGPQEAKVCAEACRVGLQQAHDAHPEEPKCYECTIDAQCDHAAGELCYLHRCQTSHCGDGIVEPGEVCDGQSLCDEECQSYDTCSPLTGAGCDEGSACAFNFYDVPYHSFCIAPENNFSIVGLGEECGEFFEGGEPSVRTCEVGAYCAIGPLASPPCDTDRCCRLLCDTTQAASCPEGKTCGALQVAEVALSYIGACQ